MVSAYRQAAFITATSMMTPGSLAPADGETIGRRIRINQPDDENARCKASRASDQHKDFSPFTQQPTTLSTFNAISFQQGRTELFEPLPWTHGVRPLRQHEHDHQRDHSRLSFDNVTKPFEDICHGRMHRPDLPPHASRMEFTIRTSSPWMRGAPQSGSSHDLKDDARMMASTNWISAIIRQLSRFRRRINADEVFDRHRHCCRGKLLGVGDIEAAKRKIDFSVRDRRRL